MQCAVRLGKKIQSFFQKIEEKGASEWLLEYIVQVLQWYGIRPACEVCTLEEPDEWWEYQQDWEFVSTAVRDVTVCLQPTNVVGTD